MTELEATDKMLDLAMNTADRRQKDEILTEVWDMLAKHRQDHGMEPLDPSLYVRAVVPPAAQRIAAGGSAESKMHGDAVYSAWQAGDGGLFTDNFRSPEVADQVRKTIIGRITFTQWNDVVIFPPLLARANEKYVMLFDQYGKWKRNRHMDQAVGALVMMEEPISAIVPVLYRPAIKSSTVRAVCNWYDLEGEFYHEALQRVLNYEAA